MLLPIINLLAATIGSTTSAIDDGEIGIIDKIQFSVRVSGLLDSAFNSPDSAIEALESLTLDDEALLIQDFFNHPAVPVSQPADTTAFKAIVPAAINILKIYQELRMLMVEVAIPEESSEETEEVAP